MIIIFKKEKVLFESRTGYNAFDLQKRELSSLGRLIKLI